MKYTEKIDAMGVVLAYKSWINMLRRCDNPTDKEYPRYGGRGISYQSSWKDFNNFYYDMGGRGAQLSIDRINNKKNYTKNNCRWSSRSEQTQNRKNTVWCIYEKKKMPLGLFCKLIGVKPKTAEYTKVYSLHKEGYSTKEIKNKLNKKI